jgi:TrmH family RNA methyltransferase
VAEGIEVVRCGLGAGAVPEALYVAAEARGTAAVESLATEVLSTGSRVFPLGRGVADRVADTVTPHPVFAVFSMTDVALSELTPPTLALVCLDVRDPGNAGTVLRTADAAGVDVVFCCGGTVDPFNPKTVRSSAGSVFHVPLVVSPDVDRPLAWLREHGVTLYGTAAVGTDYASVDLVAPCAFVVGNESAGLPPAVARSLDGSIGIPMSGRAESLNVGVASAVLCFEARRQRRATADAPRGPAYHAGMVGADQREDQS